MAMKAEDALNLARAYTKKSLEGAGALKGEDGEDGKSAYQVAVDNGFDGTEEEWLDSLKAGSVEISKEKNNALEEKEDGLYVGITGKTYKSLDELGLVAPVEVYAIESSLSVDSKFVGAVSTGQVTDIPGNGTLIVEISPSGETIARFYMGNAWYDGVENNYTYNWKKIATTDDFVKTYKSIEETGVTTPCTLSSLVSAMGAPSELHCSASKNIITDLPIGGSLKIEVSKNNTYFIHLWNSEYYYVANYVGSGQFEWKKIARTDDVLSLAGGYMKDNAFLIFPGSGEGASSKITNTEIMVDDANNNKTTSVTAEGIDTPSLKINGEDVSFGTQEVPTYNMNELTTPGIYFKIDGSYMHNAPSRYGTPDDTLDKPDHFAIIEVIAYSSQFMPKPLIIQKYYRINYNEDCGNDCATRHQSNFGWGEWTYEADTNYVDSKQTTMDVLVNMHNLNDDGNVTLSKAISNYKLLVFSMYAEHNNSVGNKISVGTNTIPVDAFNVNDQMLFASTYMSDVVCGITAMSLSDTQLFIDNLSDFDSTVLSTYVTIYGIK